MELALTIINPGLLWAGTALASVPVIIHLLNRLRFKRVVWAAMEFLVAAHRKNARRVRIEHLILLIIRTLIVLLLAAALARPVLEGLLATLGRSAVHRVLVIDDSFRMGAKAAAGVEGDAVIKQARKAATTLMASFDKRDGVSLVLVGSRPHVRIGAPSYNHEQIQAEIERLQASDSTGDETAALEETKKVLAESHDLEKKIVYVITDATRTAWQAAEGKKLSAVAADLTKTAALVIVDVGRVSRPNLAIHGIVPEKSAVTTRIATRFRIEVENLGDQPVENVTVDLTVDGQRASPVALGTLAPHKSATGQWVWRFEQAGEHAVTAALEESSRDAVAADSVRYLTVNVQPAVNVLLVDGEPATGGRLGATGYLAAALDPRALGDESATEYAVTTIRDSELEAGRQEGQDFVILADVAALTAAQTAALERFVGDGGSLVVFLGKQVRAAEYNQTLYANGKGLLPGSLVGVLGSTEAGEEAKGTKFDVKHFEHPALAAFKARDGAGLDRVDVHKYFQVKLPAEAKDVSPILYFQDGNPAIVEKQFERGRVVLVATTADAQWTALPRLPLYVPLVHEIMRYMLPDTLWRYNRLVDAETSLPVSAGQSRDSFVVTRPKFGTTTATPRETGGGRFALVLDDLSEAGLYTVENRGGFKRRLAVNVDTRGSELVHLSKEELAERLGHGPMVFASGEAELTAALENQQSAGGWARNLLAAMLALVLLETVLAWAFNRGA